MRVENQATREPLIETRRLEISLGGRRVVGPLDLRITAGTFLGVVGPNGSGKTTLLRGLTGALRPSAGQVLLQGLSLAEYSVAEIARQIAVVPQQFNLDFSFTVEETVAMGRYVHSTPFRWSLPYHKRSRREERLSATAAAGPQDSVNPMATTDPVEAALEATGLSSLADRLITQLSGGERQRAVLAQALAQETPILLLDEPLNNLDLNHQLEVMQLLARLHAEGRTIIVVLHDLNMAAQYCEELLLLHEGREFAHGAPVDVLDPATVLEVFKVRVVVHRQGRRPYLTPLWSRTPVETPATEQPQIHVMAGGGAASEIIEELVLHGYTPTVGIVSVFDTDYLTAERYGLRVVSAPPFEPYPPETIAELEEMVDKAESIVVAPVFFGQGNLTLLETALRARRAGKQVLLVSHPSLAKRDLTRGEAESLGRQLSAAGAIEVAEIQHIIKELPRK